MIISDICPNCLGHGTIPQVISRGYGKRHTDTAGEYPKVTCLVCHGTGKRPEWMNDMRHFGHLEEDDGAQDALAVI